MITTIRTITVFLRTSFACAQTTFLPSALTLLKNDAMDLKGFFFDFLSLDLVDFADLSAFFLPLVKSSFLQPFGLPPITLSLCGECVSYRMDNTCSFPICQVCFSCFSLCCNCVVCIQCKLK